MGEKDDTNRLYEIAFTCETEEDRQAIKDLVKKDKRLWDSVLSTENREWEFNPDLAPQLLDQNE